MKGDKEKRKEVLPLSSHSEWVGALMSLCGAFFAAESIVAA